MRNFILAISLLLSLNAFAGESCTESAVTKSEGMTITTDVPAHLKGATITIRTADGRTSTVPAEKFKVVPRKQQFIVTNTESTKTCRVDPNKNRVSLLGGQGPKGGLDVDRSNPAAVSAESRQGFVGGAQYQRMLTEKLSVGGQVQSNRTGSLLIGVDF